MRIARQINEDRLRLREGPLGIDEPAHAPQRLEHFCPLNGMVVDPAAKASNEEDRTAETGPIVAGLGYDGRG